MEVFGSRTHAILWAQWRTLRNRLPRSSKAGLLFTALASFVWYGSFATLAIAAAELMADPNRLQEAASLLPAGLFTAFLYWQAVPLLLASTGSALDTKKLLAYPIAKRELFGLEVLLRVTTGPEVIIVLLGVAIGLFLNPRIPAWAPFSLLLFGVFNLLVSAGIRDLVARLFARKVIREILVLLFVLAAALPQVLLLSDTSTNYPGLAAFGSSVVWPWTAAARLAQGHFTFLSASALLAWTLAAYGFGRWQFERGLTFDEQEHTASSANSTRSASLLENLYRLPGRVFGDPLGALIEKELRFLSRSPRFRLVFFMGFSFGLLIWLPVALGRTVSSDSWIAHNYLTLVSAYALLLLGDVLFWNAFGFDRGAAQLYFLAPIEIRTVLLGKNLAALFWIVLEVLLVTSVCALFRLPMSADKLLAALCATLTITPFLMAAGNLTSIYSPKAVDASKSFRKSAGQQTQMIGMLCFPLALSPVALAYAARYAFQTRAAFYGVLFLGALFGLMVYRIATDTAVTAAVRRKEAIASALSSGQGPVGA